MLESGITFLTVLMLSLEKKNRCEMPPKKSKGRKKRSAEEEEDPGIPQPPSPTDDQNEAVEEYSEQPAEPSYAGGCSEDDGEEDYFKTKIPE